MRIKKISQTTATLSQIINGYSTSTTDAYSCAYVNSILGDIETILTTLISGGGVA